MTDIPETTYPVVDIKTPHIPSGWRCNMFGARTVNDGLSWTPAVGNVPNWFQRKMMKIFFACNWERVEDD